MTKAITFKATQLVELHKGEAAIATALKSIHKRGQSLQRDVHIAACSILHHIEEHRDVRVVEKFIGMMVNALPESYRINAMRDWLVEFGPIAFDQNKPVFVKDKATDMAGALKTPFWHFSPEKPYQALDKVKAIDALIKKFQKDQDETGEDHSATIAALELAKAPAPAVTIQ
ncbi:hypothetical protein [Rhizobium phage RHEph27]|uniref:Uncharacterized protein n=1 Tax=Rhizobium phage RHph_TM34 TaxID=2509556 RepID=A0A7S5QVQ6_9CAUD|nr:hypothetical protein EVB35_001 [Rhizobium phage RHph_TM34]QXV74956.1 hypothetical protein [Rhizobium phage RHEph27]